MEEVDWGVVLDQVLPPPVRTYLEERFWRPIEARATLEVLRDDPAFLADPGTHPAMFADHGVVHARDVATGLLRLVDTIDGVLLPGRPPARRRFLETIGVAAAYIHDIGMVDTSPKGRRDHPVFAVHAAFGPDLRPLVDHLLAPGPVRARLEEIAARAPFAAPFETVAREMLSLSAAHSKSAIAGSVLDDRVAFRRLLQRMAFTSMDDHRASDRRPSSAPAEPILFDVNLDGYTNPSQSFAWLVATAGPHAELADDVVDAMRALRAADVLRQRGTVLRTSAGFEICIDAVTAKAVCTLRPATGDAAYVVTYDDERGAGEANIRAAFVTPQGHLRIALHRGAFAGPGAGRRAAASVASVILDIAADVVTSFGGDPAGQGLGTRTRSVDDLRIQLERPDDRPAFADEVLAHPAGCDASLAGRLVAPARTEGAAPEERRRFLAGEPVPATGGSTDELLVRMAEHGADTAHLDRAVALSEVCRATVRPGEVLVAPGSPPSFVYIPTGPGLVVRPDGGHAPSPLPPWVPVGTTGVIRRAERNSQIVAEHEVDVIVIPGELYARAWLRPLGVGELVARLQSPAAST